MAAPGGRRLSLLVLAGLVAAVAGLLFGSAWPASRPGPTSAVAALTSGPSDPAPVAARSPEGTASAAPAPSPSAPAATPGPPPTAPPPTAPPATAPPASGLVPGSVNRTSLDLVATYDVNAILTVGTGGLDVSTTLVVRNAGDQPIDRLELNTIAARLGRIRVTAATVDEAKVKVRVQDQTLIVPLGGVLGPGATTTVLVAYRATLATGLDDSSWMFSRFGGTFTLYRWIPWISRALPFDRPNQGDPFVTVSSPEVSVEILADLPLDIAAPAAEVAEFEAGTGRAWAFTVHDVRDVSVVLGHSLFMAKEKVGDVQVRAYSSSSFTAADRLLSLTADALRRQRARLDVAYPWPALVAVETLGGEALESPGLIWIPRNLDTLNRTYLVHHEVAHQWFYGLVGNDQRNQPFADEAAADFLARTVLVSFRPTRCSVAALDRSIAGYAGRCYYEVIYVQGGLLLDDLRRRMGNAKFWAALKSYIEANRNGIATTRDLLDTLDAATDLDLRRIVRARFPSLY